MRNRTKIAAALSLATCFVSQAAMSQDGALWRDDKGRQMEVGFAGGGAPAPLGASWTPPRMAEMFNQLCIETEGEALAVKAAIAARELTDKSYEMPVGKDKGSWPLVIARGDGVVVSQAERFLSNPRRQCNVTFYLAESGDPAGVESALAELLGRPADNSGKRTKKNGKPNRYYSPEWAIEPIGATIKVGPVASSGGPGYQFSLLANKEGRK